MKFRIFITTKNNQEASIILSSEEISNIDFGIASNSFDTATTEPNMNIRISGYFLSAINNETDVDENPLNMKNLVNNFQVSKLDNLSNALNQSIKQLGETFKSSLYSKLTTITKDISQFDTSNLQKMNFENLKALTKWSLSYGTENDYRDVVVEVYLNETMSKIYMIPDMYVVDYNESIGQSNGDGHFSIYLKQKLYSETKIILI